jgi:hypothetical protein
MKNKKEIVKSYNLEFGYELLSAIPYAYKLFKEGKLKATESGIDTAALYYFSPQHKENSKKREWKNMKDAWANNLPNVNIHRPDLDWELFEPPNYKEQYRNSQFIYNKPTLCIFNRINKEWNRTNINYFDLTCLRTLFDMLKDKYQIIYFNIQGKSNKYLDGVQPIDIGDYEMIKNEYKDSVLIIHDIQKENKDISFNTLQLMIMANCERFISMNGGYGILASYFGGTNIIYSKECKEMRKCEKSFYRWYHKLSGARVKHVANYPALYNIVNDIFVDDKQLINILIRTSGRPQFFKQCYLSIINQTYKNVNIIVGTDDEESRQYVIPYEVYPIEYDKKTEKDVDKTKENTSKGACIYGKIAPYNLYMNEFNPYVKDGWIMYLDDDDCFKTNTALETIVAHITDDKDFILWRNISSQRVVPNDEHFGKEPFNCDIAGDAFLFHSNYLKDVHWEGYRKGNYRVALKLYKKLNPVWINEILTGTQLESGENGNGFRKDKAEELIINEQNNKEQIINININLNLIDMNFKTVTVIQEKFKHNFIGKKGSHVKLEESIANELIKKGLVKEYIDKEAAQVKEQKEILQTKEFKEAVETKKRGNPNLKNIYKKK